MFSKTCLSVGAQILLLQGILCQSIGAGISGAPLGACGCGGQARSCAPISGGGFIVSSTSPISPTGLYVLSENTIEGTLGVTGEVPFLAAVSLEGAMDSKGQSGVEYQCGDCNVGITSENAPAAPGPCCGGIGAGPYAGAGPYGAVGPYGGAGLGAGFGAPLGGGLGGGLGAGYGAGFGAGPLF